MNVPPVGRHIALLAALLIGVSACASTVQQRSTTSLGSTGIGDGLSAPTEPATGTTAAGVGTTPVQQQVPGGGVGQPVSGATQGSSTRDPGHPSGQPVPGSGSVLSGSAPVTSKIQIGILDLGTANGASSSIGSSYSTSTTAADATKAMVRWYNKHGGIAGRQIEPVEYTVEVTSSNYVTQTEAACADFTQDHHVAAVISVVANAYYSSYEACLNKAHVVDVEGPTGGTDDQDLAANPGLVSATAPSTNRRFEQMLTRFVASGYLTAKSKIGIVVETCNYNERAYAATIAPVAKRLGLTLVRRDVSCVNGFSDAGAFIAAVGSTVLPFHTANVDKVMFLSNFEGVALLGFENVAKQQGYTPSYALTSTTGGASLAGQFDNGQLQRMRGVGWTPVLDIGKRVLASPTTARCRMILKSEGIVPQSKADDLLDLVCDQFFALEASLKAAHGHSDRASLLAGLHSLGTGYVSPYTLKGATDYTVRRDGPRLFAIWGYQAACSCMDYLSSPS